MKKIYLTIFCLFLSSSCLAQGLSKYDSTGNPKAKGISLIVKYPSDWRASEGERPNIVQKFYKDYPDYTITLIVQVNNLPDGAEKEISSFTAADWRDILNNIGTSSNIYETKLENQRAFIGDVSIKMERVGMTLNQKQRVLGLTFKNKWIWLWCGVTGMPNLTATQVSQTLDQNQQKCFSFFNSLVLSQSYPK